MQLAKALAIAIKMLGSDPLAEPLYPESVGPNLDVTAAYRVAPRVYAASLHAHESPETLAAGGRRFSQYFLLLAVCPSASARACKLTLFRVADNGSMFVDLAALAASVSK